MAKVHNIDFDPKQNDNVLYYQITETMKLQGLSDVIDTLNANRRAVINEAEKSPAELITWLYSNQGEMRFGSENRIFLILIKVDDMTQSWKMKREFSIIEPEVNSFLDNFSNDSLRQIDFTFKGSAYHSLSSIIFIKSR